MTATSAPRIEHRFTIHAEVGPYRHVGDIGDGVLEVVPITGGTVVGAGIDGDVLTGGADWAVFRADDSIIVDARYQIRTAAGVVIDVHNTGLVREPDGAGGYRYFATRPVFRSADPELAWLTASVFVGWARTGPAGTSIDVFAVVAPAE